MPVLKEGTGTMFLSKSKKRTGKECRDITFLRVP